MASATIRQCCWCLCSLPSGQCPGLLEARNAGTELQDEWGEKILNERVFKWTNLDWSEPWNIIFAPPDHAGDLWQHTDIQTTRLRQVRVQPSSTVHIHDIDVHFCSDVLPQRCVAHRSVEARDRGLSRNRYTCWPLPAVTAASLCHLRPKYLFTYSVYDK